MTYISQPILIKLSISRYGPRVARLAFVGEQRLNQLPVLKGIFWVLRSGAPWWEKPERYGPRTTYNP